MKTVIHIKNFGVVTEQVPDDWIECSISGEFRPPEEFRRDGQQFQSRTNCTRTYEMSVEECLTVKDTMAALKPKFDKEKRAAHRVLYEQCAGVSLADYINQLQEFLTLYPNARIVSGEYSSDAPEDPQQLDSYHNVFVV